MALLDFIFKKPRLYDDNFQIERIPLVFSGTSYDYTIPNDANLEIISVLLSSVTDPVARTRGPYYLLQFYDGDKLMFQGGEISILSGETYNIVYQRLQTQSPGLTSLTHYRSSLPAEIFLIPGMRIHVEFSAFEPLDTFTGMFITAKRWKL